MHSTNYFARYQMEGLRPIGGEELTIGQLVYKAREDIGQLNDRYKPDGRYYKPEHGLTDYYHVGVVTDKNPLEITHCTSYGSVSGIVRDGSTKGWTLVGELLGVDYATDIHVGRNEEEPIMSRTAYVANLAPGTTTANLRTRPNASADRITKVTMGTVVDVLEEADGWARISTPDGDTGYMMSQFLKPLGVEGEEPAEEPQEAEQEAETAPDKVTLTLQREAAAALFKALSEVAF
jgi:hypothetical protein